MAGHIHQYLYIVLAGLFIFIRLSFNHVYFAISPVCLFDQSLFFLSLKSFIELMVYIDRFDQRKIKQCITAVVAFNFTFYTFWKLILHSRERFVRHGYNRFVFFKIRRKVYFHNLAPNPDDPEIKQTITSAIKISNLIIKRSICFT